MIRKNLVLGLSAFLLCVTGASSASALSIDARISGIFTDSSLSTQIAGVVIDGNGDATASLATGQIILLDVIIDNTPTAPSFALQPILALGASIIFQGDQIDYLGPFIIPSSILQEAGAGGASLANIGSGHIKSGQPGSQGLPGDVWLQALAYGTAGGVDGSGEQTAVVSLAFVVTGTSGNDQIAFELGLTAGDSIIDPNGIRISTTFSSAFVNVPEPGTALLVSLGLLGLASSRRRRN